MTSSPAPRSAETRRKWNVVQNGRVVCANLTRWQADNKVENERRMGWIMTVEPVGPKLGWIEEECDD